MQRGLKWLAVSATLVMLLILLGGALVTKTESGAGCGKSWPLCHGELIPSEITPELVIELSHRVVSGAGGLLVLALSVWAWFALKHVKEARFLAVVSFFFLLLQALIGAAAVVWGQSDAVLALHFGISLISFASVFLLTLMVFEVDKKFDASSVLLDSKMKFHIYGVIIYSYIVVYTGALVRHTNASLACPSVPFCSQNRFFPVQMHEWVQMGHRFAATLIFVWILIAFIHAYKCYRNQKVVYYGWMVAFILVSLQVVSGVTIIFTRLNLFVALLHALIISCLFGVLSYLTLVATRSKKAPVQNQTK